MLVKTNTWHKTSKNWRVTLSHRNVLGIGEGGRHVRPRPLRLVENIKRLRGQEVFYGKRGLQVLPTFISYPTGVTIYKIGWASGDPSSILHDAMLFIILNFNDILIRFRYQLEVTINIHELFQNPKFLCRITSMLSTWYFKW